MTTWFAEPIAAPILWLLVKATALVGLAGIVQTLLMRRASAAARHLMWMSVLVGLLLLPVASRILPAWSFPVGSISTVGATAASKHPALQRDGGVPQRDRQSTSRVVEIPASSVPSPAAHVDARAAASIDALERSRSRIYPMAIGIYIVGVIAVAIYWFAERWQLRRFIDRASTLDDREWTRVFSESARAIGVVRSVRLLKSRERNVPLAVGTRRPAIVVPSIAETWEENRRRAVLSHELAHVARFDCLTHGIALAACAMYWFHPAVWLVARRIRIERELACDDRVIAAGTEPREYASHLLDIAYSLGGRRAPALAVCMARPRQLEGRMLAALDGARNRRRPSTRVRIAAAIVALVVLAAVAAAGAVPTVASEPPANSEQQWPRMQNTREAVHSAKTAVQQDVQALAHLPADGLKQVRAAVRAVASVVSLQQENMPGTWEIRPTDTKGMVHLRIAERNSSSGTNVPIEQLEGLTAGQLTGAGGPVQFKVRRDAGIFTFEGVIRSGVGAGTFTFDADPAFSAELVKRGFARPTPDQQYAMARHDTGYAFIDELTKQGYSKSDTSELVRAGQHGVQATYLREMGALGYRLGTLDALITLRDHGITPSYVRALADNGYKGLSADSIREARDHGITPEYVQAMRDAGYSSMPIEQLIRVRDHGITPEYVRALGDAGYRKLPIDQLVRARDHGVTTEYVRDLRQLGYSLPIDDLVRARDHGVTAEFAKEVKALGYDTATIDDLVALRDHGVTAERIRSANARAGTRLPIDMLKSLADGGMR